MERGAHQLAHYCEKREITEIHAALLIINKISPFQVHKIHCGTPLQYSPALWVVPTCSGISIFKNSAPRYGKLGHSSSCVKLAQSVLYFVIEHSLVPSNYVPNFRAIAQFLPKAVGPQSGSFHSNLTLLKIPQIPNFSMEAPHQILNNSANSLSK